MPTSSDSAQSRGRKRGFAHRIPPLDTPVHRTYLLSMLSWRIIGAVVAYLLSLHQLAAIQITGYSSAANDRFSSDYPSSPVNNASISFVGKDYNWSGVGWAASNPTKSFGFLSPQHYLVARHYGGDASIQLFGGDGQVHSATQSSITETGYGVVFSGQTVGDISLGRLTAPVISSWAIARYGVLDLNSSSTSSNSYNGQPLLIYGRGANGTESTRIGATAVTSTVLSGANSYITTSRNDVQLEGGDSGSPVFIGWTNPNGGKELTILGNNAAIDSTSNYLNYIANPAVINQLNSMMTPDGYALRVVGNAASTWQGDASSSISASANWSGFFFDPTDKFCLFDAGSATRSAITVNSNTNLRGAYFKATASASDAFTFSGSSTLTIGRGGLTNYDNSRQVFSANITLGDHQYWDAGGGGITATSINTNAKLLEITGIAATIISGQISGTGGIALSGGRLDLGGTSSYTGKTWVHVGTLSVGGSIASSSGVSLDAGAILEGSGGVSSISGAGSVDPGNSTGILKGTSLNPGGGLDFNFEFTQTGAPTYGNSTASGNDLLRLTAAIPFSQALSSSNVIGVFFNRGSLLLNDSFRGGFFTDLDSPFLSIIQGAAFHFYLSNPGGPVVYNGVNYDQYFGPLTFQLGTVAEVAGFSSGSEPGYVLQLTAVPEPSPVLLSIMGLLLLMPLLSRLWARNEPDESR